MDALKQRLNSLSKEFDQAYEKLGIADLAAQLNELTAQMQKADFWSDSETAQEVSKNSASLMRRVEPWQKLKKEIVDFTELVELGEDEMTKELNQQFDQISTSLEQLKEQLKFQGSFDDHDVILNFYAGAGGTDAQDFAEMLLRMYLRWAESAKLKVEVIDESRGDEAGIKSATVQINGGDFLYGRLSGESGVHRLVRQSPFNADHKRQTSFAKVEVLPLINKPDEVKIDDKDLKIDVFRSGGRGGQSVNTTDSAVRITHIPTGVTVAIQNERSQLQNKANAMNILRSKLVQLQLEQHAADLAHIKGPNQSVEWGNQIRNYVLHPYKQVKDLRSGYESSDPQRVLDGNLEPLIEAHLEKL